MNDNDGHWEMVVVEDGEKWYVTAEGVGETFIMNTMMNDGSEHQTMIGMRLPMRINLTDEHETLQIALSPETAVSLATNILQCAIALHEEQEGGDQPIE